MENNCRSWLYGLLVIVGITAFVLLRYSNY
jgi:hypothetical protein